MLISRYEQQLGDTRSWLNAQQKSHLDIALQTLEMRQRLSRDQKYLDNQRKMQNEQAAKQQRIAADLDARQVANIRYMAAQRIQRFVVNHIPLTTDNIQLNPIDDETVSIHYRLSWQMSPSDIETVCRLFYESGIAERCHVSEDNKKILVKASAELSQGLFLPFSDHQFVWKNPLLTLFVTNQTATNPPIFVIDQNDLTIMIGNQKEMSLVATTQIARATMAHNQDLIGGSWQ